MFYQVGCQTAEVTIVLNSKSVSQSQDNLFITNRNIYHNLHDLLYSSLHLHYNYTYLLYNYTTATIQLNYTTKKKLKKKKKKEEKRSPSSSY